jgi:hypothetical protein
MLSQRTLNSRVHLQPEFLSHCYPVPETLYLLTHSTEQSPSWETNRFVANQEITLVLLNPKVHYRIYKCPLTVSILSQPNPVHTPTSHFLKIYFSIILPSMPGSPHWSISLRFPKPKSYACLSPPHLRYMSRPSHSSRLYHPHNTGWGVQIMKLREPLHQILSFILSLWRRFHSSTHSVCVQHLGYNTKVSQHRHTYRLFQFKRIF